MATLEDFLENPFPPAQPLRLSVFGVVTKDTLQELTEKAKLLYRTREDVRRQMNIGIRSTAADCRREGEDQEDEEVL